MKQLRQLLAQCDDIEASTHISNHLQNIGRVESISTLHSHAATHQRTFLVTMSKAEEAVRAMAELGGEALSFGDKSFFINVPLQPEQG